MLKEFELIELKQDSRGEICILRSGKNESFLSFTRKGISRSGYHFKPNRHIEGAPSRIYCVLNGKFLFKETDLKSGKEIQKEIKTGDTFSVYDGVAHMFTALEDSWMIEFTPGSTSKEEQIPYSPYREAVEKDIA